jgi:4-oxalocrotonate tautomerase
MPLLNVQIIENVFTPEQKQSMIAKITDAMVAIEGEALRSVTGSRTMRSRKPTRALAAKHCAPAMSTVCRKVVHNRGCFFGRDIISLTTSEDSIQICS